MGTDRPEPETEPPKAGTPKRERVDLTFLWGFALGFNAALLIVTIIQEIL